MTTATQNIESLQSATQSWFDNMVSNLRVDQLLLESDCLEGERKDIYHAMINGNEEYTHSYVRNTSSMFFIKNLIDSYLHSLVKMKAEPKRLAFELSNSKVLVWAEIQNDDEITEDALILSAAKVNNNFSKFGFHISSTIVETEDNIDVPAHYKEVTVKNN